MFKKIVAAALVTSFVVPAFAQEGVLKESRTGMDMRPSKFSQFVMKGYSVGLDYGQLDAEIKVKLTYVPTGQTFEMSGGNDEKTSAMGISVNYAHLPRARAGFIGGLSIIKKMEDNKETDKSTMASSGEMMIFRPELNVALSLANGLYGAAGANIGVLKADSEGIDKVGYGLQLQAGYVPVENVSMDLGYYITRYSVNQIGSSSIVVDSANSYAMMKQLRARLSYMF